MQRLVKWTEGSAIFTPNDNPKPVYLGGAHEPGSAARARATDLDHGAVFALDLTPTGLTNRPELREALTYEGRLGKVVSHNYEVVGSNRIWTFVVEF